MLPSASQAERLGHEHTLHKGLKSSFRWKLFTENFARADEHRSPSPSGEKRMAALWQAQHGNGNWPSLILKSCYVFRGQIGVNSDANVNVATALSGF